MAKGGLGRVLVTGGAGFFGGVLVERLLELGYRVRVLDLVQPRYSHPAMESCVGDICDRGSIAAACADVDTVFHLAACIDVASRTRSTPERRERVAAVNIEGTKRIVEQMRKQGGGRVVYTSTASVIFDGRPVRGGTEAHPYATDFVHLYSETKAVAEQWVLAQNGIGGVQTCAIRPSGIWGRADDGIVSHCIKHQASGTFPAQIDDRGCLVDYSYADNLVHGHILAARQLVAGGRAAGQAYFINDDVRMGPFELPTPILAACGLRLPKSKMPGWFVHALMSAWEEVHFRFGAPAPPLTPPQLTHITVDNYYSVSKARKDLGYEPLYSFEEAVARAIPGYLAVFGKKQGSNGSGCSGGGTG